ncbi:MAG TPA: T9SS type A sorting domain-containing protein, partial [Bacteroidia bacterium]|nr:T9SS type A sorting domain-containing protein [Bacteroidia bacterium]
DAGGGGGGGGTIFIYSYSATVTGLTLNANGGNGGSQNLNNGGEVEGNGGGGGGGYISTTNPVLLTRNVNGGTYGTTNAPPMVNFTANGATSGGAGTIVNNPTNPYTTPTALPIELKSFDANPESEGSVTLSWVTASEINNDYFTLERSTDGMHYSVINKQPGAGNSTTERYYSFTDTEPDDGDNFYRLTQTDYDGKFETFDPVHVYVKNKNASGAAIANAYPNPFSDRFEVNMKGVLDSRGELTLVNSGGVTIRSIPIGPDDISRTQAFDNLEGLPSGLYILYLTDAEGKNASMVKLVKR